MRTFINTESENGHQWGFYEGFAYEMCRICGGVRRADKQSKPCKGLCRIGLRNTEKQEGREENGR